MNILFTGSRGTLGRPLVAELRKRHRVIGWDLQHCGEPDEVRCDIGEWAEVDRCSFPADVVFHFAAEFGRKNGCEFPERMWKTNVIGTRHVLEMCRKWDCPIVFASSSEAYGDLADSVELLHEDLLQARVPRFHNEYALSKWTNEKQIDLSGVPYVILRIFNVYGPGERATGYRSVVAEWVKASLKGAKSTAHFGWRTHLYIEDLVACVAKIPDKLPQLLGTVINVADDEPVFNDELHQMVFGKPPKNSELEVRNVTRKLADNTRFRELLGYDRSVEITEGIARTKEWMRLQSAS